MIASYIFQQQGRAGHAFADGVDAAFHPALSRLINGTPGRHWLSADDDDVASARAMCAEDDLCVRRRPIATDPRSGSACAGIVPYAVSLADFCSAPRGAIEVGGVDHRRYGARAMTLIWSDCPCPKP